MMSSRVQKHWASLAVPELMMSCALPSHTSVPWDRPEIRISSSMVEGLVSIQHAAARSRCRTRECPACRSGRGSDPPSRPAPSGLENRLMTCLSSSGISRKFTPVSSSSAVHHGGIVVAQTVQLHQNVVHGVEVVVGGDDGCRSMSSAGCWMAVNWQMSYSLGSTTMPPGCWPVVRFTPTQPAASRSFSARPALMPRSSRYLRSDSRRPSFPPDRDDGAGSVHVALAEKLLDVGMGPGLIFAGEVQVDVGHLVALEAQEDLEGDVVAVLFERLAAELRSSCPADPRPRVPSSGGVRNILWQWSQR